ncbi:hypothetical protein HY346_02765 [Candidatus Microgenomates bacterium]|nr:hypothetical protein [Candidatus Microgenomates bacterium]
MVRLRSWLRHLLVNWLPNLVLVLALVVLVQADLILLAFGLILVSKWQMLRGGWRLWLRNLRDNACDLTVAVSSVVLLITLNHDLPLQLGVAVVYLLWLILIKPLTGHAGVAIQSMFCQFEGLLLIFLLGRQLPVAGLVALAWVVGLVAADHLLSAYHERAHMVIALAWALVVAQASWLFWNWLIVYSFWDGRLLIPQGPVIISLIGYIFGSMYLDHMQTKLGKRRLFEYVMLFFVICLVLIVGTQWDTRL